MDEQTCFLYRESAIGHGAVLPGIVETSAAETVYFEVLPPRVSKNVPSFGLADRIVFVLRKVHSGDI